MAFNQGRTHGIGGKSIELAKFKFINGVFDTESASRMNEGRILNDGEQNEVARRLRRFAFEPERADELRSGSAHTRFARLIAPFADAFPLSRNFS